MISLSGQVRLPSNVMGYEQETSSKRRWIGVVIALVLHVVLIYAFTTGLAIELVKKVQRTVDVAIVSETKPPPPPEPVEIEADSRPKQKARAPTKAYVPKAEVQNTKRSPDAISAVTSSAEDVTPVVEKAAPAVPDAPPQKAEPVKTMARLMRGCRPPQYPKRSEEKGEEGTVVFRFLVGTDGRVQSAQLVRSSGFERLDNAAKEAFMQCSFTPGTVDGVPLSSWVKQPFTWRLK